LPADRWNEIRNETRREFGVTGEIDRCVSRIKKIAGWSAFAVTIGIGFGIGAVWGWESAFLFFITFVGPAMIGQATYAILLSPLMRRFAPNYFDYETTEKRRLESAREEYQRKVVATAEYWRGLAGHEFEHEFAKLLNNVGYKAAVTKGSGDGGIDIIAQSAEGRVAIQCKRYKKPVGPAVIRELYGAVNAGGFDLGILAVTGGVTRGVDEFIKGKPLRVIGIGEIVAMQMEFNATMQDK